MKIFYFLTILLVFASMSAFSQQEINASSESLLTVLRVSNSLTATAAAGKGAAISLGAPGAVYSTKIATIFEQSNPSYLNPALAFFTMHNSYLAGSEVERMRISSIGNIGIGTSVPSNLLHVYSNLATTVDVAKFQNINSNGFVGVQIDRSQNLRYALLKYATSGLDDWMVGTAYNDGIPNSAYSIGRGIGLTDAKLTVLTDGKVGIGTSTPNAALDVNGNIFTNSKVVIGTTDMSKVGSYSLAVNGDAIFNKAKVMLYTTPWADYVFDEKYSLMSLKDLEKFIKINKHLPEVPTSAQVEMNGIDLGSSQAILLQKIEELILHAIEHNKQISEQSKQITQQQEQINILILKITAFQELLSK